jgi:hypothetical protein
MRTRKDNIQNRDSLSKLIQRFDGLENNNPPTNTIDGKKTGILYTSDWIDKLSYPEIPTYYENQYKQPLVGLDKLVRKGEWRYDIDLIYRTSPAIPDYGYNIIHVNDFFTIKKQENLIEVCVPWVFSEKRCSSQRSQGINWSGTFGSGTLEIGLGVSIGDEITSPLFDALGTTSSSQPFFVSTVAPSPNPFQQYITLVDSSGNPVLWDQNPDDNERSQVCKRDPHAFVVDGELPPEGATVTFSSTCRTRESEGTVQYTDSENSIYILSSFTEELIYVGVGCSGELCYGTPNPKNLPNNDVRGYVKEIKKSFTEECYNFTITQLSEEETIFTIQTEPGQTLPSAGEVISISSLCDHGEPIPEGVIISSSFCFCEVESQICTCQMSFTLDGDPYEYPFGDGCTGTICIQSETPETRTQRYGLICVVTEGDPYLVQQGDMFIWSRDEFRTDTNPPLEYAINLEALRVLPGTAELTWIDPTRLGRSFVIRVRKDGSNEPADIYYSDTLGLTITSAPFALDFGVWGLSSGNWQWSISTVYDDDKKYFSEWSEESLLIIR